MFPDGQGFEEDVKLLAKTEVLLYYVNMIYDAVSIDIGVPRTWTQHPRQHINRGSFPSPIMTKKSENFTLLDGKTQIINSRKLTELFGQVLELDKVIFLKLLALIFTNFNFFRSSLEAV